MSLNCPLGHSTSDATLGRLPDDRRPMIFDSIDACAACKDTMLKKS